MEKFMKWGGWLGLLFVLAVAPRFLGIVKTNLVVEFAIGALYAASLNILLSYTGLLSFGHALFFGAGAYTAALLLTHVEHMPLIPVVLAGGAAAVIMALVLSPLLVRVRDTAFSMLTLAFGQLMYVVCLKFREITGGEDGLSMFPIPALHLPGLAPFDMTDPRNFYYLCLAAVSLCLFLMWYFTKTPLGQVMVGIRDNQVRVGYLGYRAPLTKAVIFSVSGGFAGIAGALYALFQNVVSTDGVLSVLVSFKPIMTILVGGIGTFIGPVVGCGALIMVEEITSRFTERFELVSGLVFIGVILFAPYGLVGTYRHIRFRLAERRTAREARA
ncbi:MAG: branched-chain amino acid ABC transporter permease [Pseudomonadota bacterium]